MLGRLWREVRHTWCCLVYGPTLLLAGARLEYRDGWLVAIVCGHCGYRFEAKMASVP